MTAAGHEVESRRLDVTVEDEWREAVDAAEGRFGRVDFLINNAGILDPAGIEETTRESWDCVLAVNQTAAIQYAPDGIRVNSIFTRDTSTPR